PGLPVLDRLAGIECDRAGARLAWILVELRAGQPERILGFGLLERRHHEAQARTLGILAHQLGAPLLAPARAVFAPAIARTIESPQRQADFADRRTHVETPLVGAEAARAAREAQRRHARRVFRVERDHAAGGIAEQRRERATQDIDACRGTEFER